MTSRDRDDDSPSRMIQDPDVEIPGSFQLLMDLGATLPKTKNSISCNMLTCGHPNAHVRGS